MKAHMCMVFLPDDHYFLFLYLQTSSFKIQYMPTTSRRDPEKSINPNLKASGIIQEERKISFPSLVSMTHIMLVQVTKTSSVSLYNLHLQKLQTPRMFPSILMEISSLMQYLGFKDSLKRQYIN